MITYIMTRKKSYTTVENVSSISVNLNCKLPVSVQRVTQTSSITCGYCVFYTGK